MKINSCMVTDYCSKNGDGWLWSNLNTEQVEVWTQIQTNVIGGLS